MFSTWKTLVFHVVNRGFPYGKLYTIFHVENIQFQYRGCRSEYQRIDSAIMQAGIRNPDGELVAIPRALSRFLRRGHSRMPAAKACLVGPAVRPWLSRGESARAGRALIT